MMARIESIEIREAKARAERAERERTAPAPTYGFRYDETGRLHEQVFLIAPGEALPEGWYDSPPVALDATTRAANPANPANPAASQEQISNFSSACAAQAEPAEPTRAAPGAAEAEPAEPAPRPSSAPRARKR